MAHRILFVAVLLFAWSNLALAATVSSKELDSLQKNLRLACVESGGNGTTKAVCECSAKNYRLVLSGERSEVAQRESRWIERLYYKILTQDEYQKDEFALVELINLIHTSCIKNSNFTLSN